MELNRKNLIDIVDERATLNQRMGESRFKNIVPELFNTEGHVVYFSAFDNHLCSEVLIHRLAQPLTRETLSQIELIRRFNHDNIALYYDLVTSTLDGSSYLVSEILDTHLENVLHTEQMTYSHATLFAYQIMRGLKYLHSADLYHGGLNPSNILISCHDLLLKISGLQMGTECLNAESNLCYCPPEKLLSEENDSTAGDVWSAGCILVEMLLKRKLFRGSNAPEVLLKIIDSIYLTEHDWCQVFKLIPNKMFKNHPLKPRQPIRTIFSCWDLQVVLLLEFMLQFNEGQRATAEEVLAHSFFSEYHCPEDEPSISEDVAKLLVLGRIVESKNGEERILYNSFSMDDILNSEADAVVPTDRVAFNNFRNNLERNSPPSVRTPSPNIMDLIPHAHSLQSEAGKCFRGSPGTVGGAMQSFSSPFAERVWSESLASISSSSSCNSINSVSSRPSAKELLHKLKHVSGSDSEKETVEMTVEKMKEDAEIDGIVEALKQFRTIVDPNCTPANKFLKGLRRPDAETKLHRIDRSSSIVCDVRQNFDVNDRGETNSPRDDEREQVRDEVEKFLAAHRDRADRTTEGVPGGRSAQKKSTGGCKEVEPDAKQQSDVALKKSEETGGAWIPSGRKLLLEQIETEKKARIWSGRYKHKIHLNCKSKEDVEDCIEIGCKLTSSEFDELYRLPTEHLSGDNPLWRRYADDMNHSLTSHHYHHCFLNDDNSRSSRLSEGGACGGYDYGSLDDLGSSNPFYGPCIKCDPKISSGHRRCNDQSPDDARPVNRIVCSHKKYFAPKVLNASGEERHPLPDSPPASPPFTQSQSGARPKKSRKNCRK